jgi:DNA-binding CsgD family transcriptional regulator
METPQNSRVTLHCGIAPLRRQVALALSAQGIAVGPDADTALLLDAPVGWALWRCWQLAHSRSVIISDNPCPEYRLDLLDDCSTTLLSGTPMAEVVMALQRPDAAPHCQPETPLCPAERLTLKLLATDHSNCDIARLRSVELQTVKNTIHALYRKLHISSRLQASHYYFGNWHLLTGWTPPPHVSVPAAQGVLKFSRQRIRLLLR